MNDSTPLIPFLYVFCVWIYKLTIEGDVAIKNWKSKITNTIGKAENFSDLIRYRIKKIFGYEGPLKVVPYLGYGTASRLFLNGRVLENYIPLDGATTSLDNLLNLYKRFETDEIPKARIRARFQNVETEAVTDEGGYFNLEIKPAEALQDRLWHEVELMLLYPKSKGGSSIRAVSQVLVPPPSAKFGIISDIDDTIVPSHITNKIKMVLTVALLNERTRLPFKGVSGFYRALQRGAGGNDNNPIFYVSGSPWNLYEPLVEFLKIHGIPLGPLSLRDWGGHIIFSSANPYRHKIGKIEEVLDLYPHLPFILIGDSGELDPEIYRDVVNKYPNRIRVIYIRNINPDSTRIAAIDKLIEEVHQTGCQLVLVPDTEFAAAHAAAEGLILTDALSYVRSEKQTDENAPSPEEIIAE
ncbi:MAG TPA: phosphatase domain-containing protein [Thermodesulfobacteriota bacterium]|nr:phosphatase domain-containing protein [Thermodesulfobacteriota bacterium]